MDDRMTDERLAEIEGRFARLTGPNADYPQHIVDTRLMIRALKAERAEVERLRAERVDSFPMRHFSELEDRAETAERKLERLAGDLEVALKRQSGDHPFRSEVEAALKEARDE